MQGIIAIDVETTGISPEKERMIEIGAFRPKTGEVFKTLINPGRPLPEKIIELTGITDEMLKRPVNVGFSGGEKKKMETFQMAFLEPDLCILDEMDSGLDIDALRVVANGVNVMHEPHRAFLLITHYQRLLDYIVPDFVHIMVDGKIVETGDKSLALTLEEKGYETYK